MKKNELQRKCINDDYLSYFSPNDDSDNYYLCTFDIMGISGACESTVGKTLRRLEKAGKLKSVIGNNNRVYYCLRVDDE